MISSFERRADHGVSILYLVLRSGRNRPLGLLQVVRRCLQCNIKFGSACVIGATSQPSSCTCHGFCHFDSSDFFVTRAVGDKVLTSLLAHMRYATALGPILRGLGAAAAEHSGTCASRRRLAKVSFFSLFYNVLLLRN